MPTPPFNVLAADFLEDASVEQSVFGDSVRLVMAKAMHESELAPHLPETEGILLFHDIEKIGEASFSLAPKLKCVVRAGVGYNNVDLHAAARHGVIVCNVPDYGSEEVADHAIMFMLALARRMVICHEYIRAGSWDFSPALGTPRLRGKTFGVVGCGRIGTATALRAKAFGMDVVFFDPYQPTGLDKALGIRRVFDLGELLEQSHFVSLHCYLDEGSRKLIDAKAIARMKPGSYLINTARGPCVDEKALMDALDSGHIEGAALDVVEHEPLADDRLRHHPKVLLTPHSAFYSAEGYVELRTKAAQEVLRILKGEKPRNPVVAS
ncbi:MAG: phosphoglycerate dehydrogenase [Planctomycetes bacterium SCN 63-9]|nr:MAG: phosphoglycerate dehydrogenase [Planctomycetes bacterium SCN 63-9]